MVPGDGWKGPEGGRQDASLLSVTRLSSPEVLSSGRSRLDHGLRDLGLRLRRRPLSVPLAVLR